MKLITILILAVLLQIGLIQVVLAQTDPKLVNAVNNITTTARDNILQSFYRYDAFLIWSSIALAFIAIYFIIGLISRYTDKG